ncbi:MAG: hypothetical protein FWK01_01370 [Pantanalinema sp. GBBB05]|nr:hypothetical protein [Pantanalinema sp. GBBB05]
MNNCPCCSTPLVRHIRHREIYWFCSGCWQKMPNLTELIGSNDLMSAIAPSLQASAKELSPA